MTDSSNLDGAGDSDGGQEGAYPANAAEFAARWNAAPADFREALVQAMIANSQAAIRCLIRDHEAVELEVESLRRELDTARVWIRLLDDALPYVDSHWVIEP